ncbi:MAG TPA: ATP-binding protein [Bryobacteraceae bacterium]|nr:ATP-binding protein [Bryobacteraceae bacterium]
MELRFARLSLLWKILLSTSVAITLLFAVTGWIVLEDAIRATSESVDHEVQASFQAYQSLWKSRASLLSSTSALFSTMSDVRAAFGTGDAATIRDTAGELWSRISDQDALFLVTDPNGHVIASLGGAASAALPSELDVVRQAAPRFPRQVSGFLARDGRLYHLTITPVYVHTTSGLALLDVLVAGYEVNAAVARGLKESTGGSEFLFTSGSRIVASTLDARGAGAVARSLAASPGASRVSDGRTEYAPMRTPLHGVSGARTGELAILRSFDASERQISRLRRNIILLWLLSMAAGLGLTYLLARKLIEPVKELDRAASEVGRQNYDIRLDVRSEDELGRLAASFNQMCASIRRAREELIHQERIATIGRLASSIVHDLRNPLAAIYGGSEMLAESQLGVPQVQRLARNMHRASRQIQLMLEDLLNVCRGKIEQPERCNLRGIASAAADSVAALAGAQGVEVQLDVPPDLELPLEPRRMERVFLNLMGNALEAMPEGGLLSVHAAREDSMVLVEVRDTGPGIAPEIRGRLFQPFVTARKRNGLGLGLALARQAVVDHGGEMWVDSEPGRGACFRFRLPLN